MKKMNLQQFAGTAVTGKLKRSALIHYIDVSMGSGTPVWFRVGEDTEDMSVDLGVDTETKTNIWDETTTTDNGYEPKLSNDTYYARPSDSIYPKLKEIAMDRLTGNDCRTKVLEVLVDKTECPFDAWEEDCLLKATSYGGDKAGVAIPFDVLFDGNRTKGTVTIADKVPTFTAGTAGTSE